MVQKEQKDHRVAAGSQQAGVWWGHTMQEFEFVLSRWKVAKGFSHLGRSDLAIGFKQII